MPRAKGPAAQVDGRAKRLTLDLPEELHRALKVRSAQLGAPMAELLRALIDESLRDRTRLERLATRLRKSQ